jgi:hypothetical protein
MYDEMERMVLSCDLPERTEKLKFRVSHPMTCQCVFFVMLCCSVFCWCSQHLAICIALINCSA